jgi:hypothetical protein
MVNLNAEYSVKFDRVYIHFDDKRMTMVLAAPLKPQGIEVRANRFLWQKNH